MRQQVGAIFRIIVLSSNYGSILLLNVLTVLDCSIDSSIILVPDRRSTFNQPEITSGRSVTNLWFTAER